LTLLTKGHPEEQKLKLDRSGLGIYFGHTAIVREKDESTYIALIASRGMRPEAAWMIGNSPRSDINPALGAGINAVYIPHPRTWVLEREEIRPSTGGRLLEIEKFSDLRKHF
jgi:putative hydrolase of the HAD superfamily